jgi:uncharacterized Tic20 family protein
VEVIVGTVPTNTDLSSPTADERSMAMLSHLLMIFAGFIPPLVIYLVKKDSKFVAFHAMQGLLWHVLTFILYMIGFAGMMLSMFLTLPRVAQKSDVANPFPVTFFSFFAIFWIFFFGMWMANLILGIVYCIKANHGEWAEYPLFGRLARRIVGV